MGQGAWRRRGIPGPRHQAGRQWQCRRLACRKSLHRASPAAAPRRAPHAHAAWSRRALREFGDHMIKQLEFARAGIITKEMIYVATRENLGRKVQLERAEAALADGESFRAAVPAVFTP